MTKVNFDTLDCRILETLSVNARKPFLEIARECKVSGAAIHQRIQKLTTAGIVNGFESIINPSAVGYDTCAYIGFMLQDPSKFDYVITELRKIPEVVECHSTTGQYDLLIKLYAHNNHHLLSLIQEKIQPIGAGRTETLVSFKEEFRRQVPVKNRREN
ncbi:MAG: Lrp/AsnC ligand binding domain-containing protein [Clostridium sp.]|nr:Lrp/AsnC ligand binding domain-containing protein [Clostridium sp.]